MKKRLTLCFLLLFVCLKGKAQDTSLYQGPCDIFVKTGQVIKRITLWKIDSIRVTYNNNENLAEVLTSDVLRIVTKCYEISFDEQNHLVKRDYDLIIRHSEDTVRGFITRVMNDRYLEYTTVNGKRNKETIYDSFITSQTDNSVIAIDKQTDAETIKYTETKLKEYPSAKNNKKNKDIIVTKGGDTLLCHILKVNDVKIEYSILRFGHDERAVIDKKNVQYYRDAKEAKSGWKIPVTIAVIIAAILTIQILAASAANY